MSHSINPNVDGEIADVDFHAEVHIMNNRAINALRDVDVHSEPRELSVQKEELFTILQELRQVSRAMAVSEVLCRTIPSEAGENGEQSTGSSSRSAHTDRCIEPEQHRSRSTDTESPSNSADTAGSTHHTGTSRHTFSSGHMEHSDISDASTYDLHSDSDVNGSNSSETQSTESSQDDSSLCGEQTCNVSQKEIYRTLKTIEDMFRIVRSFNQRRYELSHENYQRKIESEEKDLGVLAQYMEYVVALAKSIDIQKEVEKKHSFITKHFEMVHFEIHKRFGSSAQQQAECEKLVEFMQDYLQQFKADYLKFPELERLVYAEIPKE